MIVICAVLFVYKRRSWLLIVPTTPCEPVFDIAVIMLLELLLIAPAASSFPVGSVVPIPTLPFLKIVTRSVP